jgi:hypothetical protein
MAAFILVHGTWAKFAQWPVLQDGLAETARAAGDEPVFEQLTWTGRNRARDRQAAASEIHTLVVRIQRASANYRPQHSAADEVASTGLPCVLYLLRG